MRKFKRIFASVLAAAALLASSCLPTSAEGLKVSSTTPRFNVYKADPEDVVKDGVIGENEYHELILDLSADSTPLYIIFGKNSSSYGNALSMLKTVRFYFSWDVEHGFNLAVKYTAPDIVQLMSVNETGAYPEDSFMNNCALSAALSERQRGKSDIDTLYYAIAKRTDTGEYLRGWYTQLGLKGDFDAVPGEDFVISYTDDGYVTYEWSIPFEDFMTGAPEPGKVVYFTLSAMAGDALIANYSDCYGVGLGDRTYLCVPTDSTRHAEGVLSGKSVEAARGTDPADSISALFSDTDDGAWYAEDLLRACNTGLVNGKSDTKFEPNTPMTRAEFVTLLYRSAGSPDFVYYGKFDDVTEDSWYGRAVVWAARRGYVNGFPDGSFHPGDPITREQIAAVFYRYARYTGEDTSDVGEIESYPDYGDVSTYAVPAMRWTGGTGLIEGKKSAGGVYLAPAKSATRAEVTVIMLRYIDKFGI